MEVFDSLVQLPTEQLCQSYGCTCKSLGRSQQCHYMEYFPSLGWNTHRNILILLSNFQLHNCVNPVAAHATASDAVNTVHCMVVAG